MLSSPNIVIYSTATFSYFLLEEVREYGSEDPNYLLQMTLKPFIVTGQKVKIKVMFSTFVVEIEKWVDMVREDLSETQRLSLCLPCCLCSTE